MSAGAHASGDAEHASPAPEAPTTSDATGLRASYERLIGELTRELLRRQPLPHFVAASLKRLGEVTGVSRTYIIAYNRDTNTVSTTAEWVADGIASHRDEFQDVPVNRFPGLRDMLLAGAAVRVGSREAAGDRALVQLMEGEHTVSLLLLPFNVFGVPYGFVGFDVCTGPRAWSDEDIDLLSSACHILAQAIEKSRWEDEVVSVERMAAMGRLAGAVAHEINNPLQSIILNIDLMRASIAGDEKSSRYLRFMEEGARRISDIVGRIVHLYRDRPEMEDVDVNDMVAGVLLLLERQIAHARCSCERDLAEGLPRVRGLRQLIHQALLNVIVNAMESLHGGGRMMISTSISGANAIIEVADNGVGIEPVDLPFVFEPFYSSKKPKRAGLGLFIAHAIVTNHGGTIIVESTPDHGTVVRIRLPLAVQ